MKTIKLTSIKPNPDNPRYITEAKFEALKRSIRDFPEMMALRPMVVDEQGVVLGGNMRLKALGELGYEDIPAAWVVRAKDLTEDQRREFVVKDNVSHGEWDWEMLSSTWDEQSLAEWGLDVWQPAPVVDYSLLEEEENTDEKLDDMASQVKKAILIEFDPEDYDEAYELIKFYREHSEGVGKIILEFLRMEKAKR